MAGFYFMLLGSFKMKTKIFNTVFWYFIIEIHSK